MLSNNYSKELIECSEQNRILVFKEDQCDKYDYLTAVGCGAIGGMIDIFLVGAPGNSILGRWTDAQVDNTVKGFAKLMGWTQKSDKGESVASAIGFLEKKFKVNYDHRHSADVDNLFNMSTKNHHMKSLAHSPDIIGLFFSVLNQFTSTATFIADGKIITIPTEEFELRGSDFVSKLFCGVVNWIGHLMSDVAGSSGSRGGQGRGSGIVMPFYELLGLCKFGEFNVGKDKQDLATIATRAFQEGYDFRHSLAMAIPVIITDLSIRLRWSLRRYFQYGIELKDCIPTQKYASLRLMLIIGNGTLCVIDGVDAYIRSGGATNFLNFFMHLNLLAWYRFITLVLKEVFIRLGIVGSVQRYIDSYKRINEALLVYLHELEQIDIEAFKKETEMYNRSIENFNSIDTNEELNDTLLEIFDKLGFDIPWQGDFDKHMSNRNGVLVFK